MVSIRFRARIRWCKIVYVSIVRRSLRSFDQCQSSVLLRRSWHREIRRGQATLIELRMIVERSYLARNRRWQLPFKSSELWRSAENVRGQLALGLFLDARNGSDQAGILQHFSIEGYQYAGGGGRGKGRRWRIVVGKGIGNRWQVINVHPVGGSFHVIRFRG